MYGSIRLNKVFFSILIFLFLLNPTKLIRLNYFSIYTITGNMTQDAFLSPLFTFFVDAVSAILPVPAPVASHIHVFSVKEDTEVYIKEETLSQKNNIFV